MIGPLLYGLARGGAATMQRCSQLLRPDLRVIEVLDAVRRATRFFPVRVSEVGNGLVYVSTSLRRLDELAKLPFNLEGRGDLATLGDLGVFRAESVPELSSDGVVNERDFILANLDLLFNSQPIFDSGDEASAFSEVATSVLNCGLPLFYGSKSAPMTEQRVVEAIIGVIHRFEPRLRASSVQVTVEGYDDLPNRSTLRVFIYGALRSDPHGHGLQFTTDLCFLTKRAERVSG